MSKSQKTFGALIEQISKTELVILNELKLLIPPLKADEYELLEKNILNEGCREPLIAWRNNDEAILIDGHNRFEICKRHGLEYRVKFKEFDTLEDAKEWMIANQLGRRNLSVEQQSYLRGLQYMSQKQGHGGLREASDQFDHLTTAERLGQEHGVSAPTIRRDAVYARGLERIGAQFPESKSAILAGKIKVKKNLVRKLGELEEVDPVNVSEGLTLDDWINLLLNNKNGSSQQDSVVLNKQLSDALQALIKCDDKSQLERKKNDLLELIQRYIELRDANFVSNNSD